MKKQKPNPMEEFKEVFYSKQKPNNSNDWLCEIELIEK